jgi:hypothetical protein
LYFFTASSTFITYVSKIGKNLTKGVNFEYGFFKILKNSQGSLEKHSDAFKQKIIHDDFSYFPIDHSVCEKTNKPLKDVREHTKVAAAEIHLPDDKIEFQVYFGIADSDHFPKHFEISNNSFQRRIVIARQKELSDSLENEERFLRREILLMKKAKNLVHALTVK